MACPGRGQEGIMKEHADRKKSRILIVDDDPGLLRVLTLRLQRARYEVSAADSGQQALALLPSFRPHVVITDMRMDGMDGLALFEAVRERDSVLPVIVLTAHGSIPDAVDATQRGVFAYLTKPFENGQLLELIERALQLGVDDDADVDDSGWRREIVTRSSAMETLLREAWMVAQSDASVLIFGESGTGKELLARAIHRASPRAAKPLVAVNCTAIPEHLLEAELFGHRKGAFTGATEKHSGLIQAADGGTLFLDEIGDMPLALQAKLLRTLEEKEVRPVGAIDVVPVDVRVISATHQDLADAIAHKRFREDLYYRLNVVSLEIPRLAERRQDIPLLAEHFLERARSRARKGTMQVRGFSRKAMEQLLAADWPGNVRQLRNVVEQCVALATTPVIPVGQIERALHSGAQALLPLSDARGRFELDYLTDLLEMTGGQVAQAARLAGRNRSQFYKLLQKHQLEPEQFRTGNSDG
jgi:two-component system, NtrC family, response regulator GlrR